MAFTKSHFIQDKKQLDANTISIQFSSLQEAILILEDLVQSFRKTQFVPTGINVIPLQFIAHEDQEAKESLWQIAPPGYLLVEAGQERIQAQRWIYGYSIVNIGHQLPIESMYFPYRLLLVTGPRKNECFFCGSRWHDSSNCTHFLKDCSQGEKILKALATYAPSIWSEKIKTGTENASFLEGLYALMAALREVFTPVFAIRVLASNNPDILGIAPGTKMPQKLEAVSNAIKNQDIRGLQIIIEDGLRGEIDPEYFILKALISILKGDIDDALLSLQRAETFSKASKIKAYSLLLQSRIHLLWGGMEGAWAAISKAAKLLPKDPHTQYWYVVIAGILREQEAFKQGLTRISSNPIWLTHLVCEPLLVGHMNAIEEKFQTLLEDIMERVEGEASSLETLCDHAHKAFSQGNFKPYLIKLRDIKGKVPMLGLMGLTDMHNALMKLSSNLYDEINKNYNVLYKELVSIRKKLIFYIKKMPPTLQMSRYRQRAIDMLQALTKDLKKLRIIKKIDEMSDIEKKVREWNGKVSELAQEVDKIIEKEYHYALIKRYCGIGVAITLATWGIFYIYHILKSLFP